MWSPGRNLGGKAGGGVMVEILVETFSLQLRSLSTGGQGGVKHATSVSAV